MVNSPAIFLCVGFIGMDRQRKHHLAARERESQPIPARVGRLAYVTWEEVTSSDFKFCPNVDELTSDSPAPVQADAQGRYPVPVPGTWTEI